MRGPNQLQHAGANIVHFKGGNHMNMSGHPGHKKQGSLGGYSKNRMGHGNIG